MALRDNTLLNLLAVPVGLLLVKRFAERTKDEPVVTPEPLIPEGFTLGPAAGKQDFNIIGESFALVESLQPKSTITGAGPTRKLGFGTDVVPFFPEGAGDPSLLKPVAGLAGLKDLPDFSGISSLNFQTGIFDPDVQARLRAKQ